MARKRIAVIPVGGTVAFHHIHSSEAIRRVAEATAYWLVIGCTIQMLRAGEKPPNELRGRKGWLKTKAFIPKELPPAEVGGCRFEDPSERTGKTFWLLAARNFVQGQILGAAQLPASPSEAEQALTL